LPAEDGEELREICLGLDRELFESYCTPTFTVHFRVDKFRGYWTPRTYSRCWASPIHAVLKATGEFIVCQDRLDLTFGDYATQSFEEIWHSQEHRRVLDSIDLDTCPRCVSNTINEVVQHVIIEDRMRSALI